MRTSIENVTRKVTAKKEGCRPAYKSVSYNDFSVHFILKEKPCLFFNNISVEDESKRSITQKIYDAVFKKKYKKDVDPTFLQNLLESDKHLEDLFHFSGKKKNCNSLDCELVIRNDYSYLRIIVLDGEGNDILKSRSRFKTGFEREEFLSDLEREIGRETYKIYRSLYEE